MAGIWKRVTLGVAAMSAVALVAGCGGGAIGGTAAPQASAPKDPLAAALAAADTTLAAGSSRVAVTMGYRTSGGPAGADSFTMTSDGVYDYERQIGEFEPPEVSGPPTGLTFGRSISARNVGYMEVPGQPGKWARADYSKIVNTPIGAQDPAAQLALLKGIAAGGVRDAGTETVRGDATRHFAITIDPKKLAATTSVVVPGGILETAMKMVKPFPADVWIDDAGLVRRLNVKIEIAGGDIDLGAAGMGNLDPEMQARLKETMKDMRTSMDIGIEYFDFGIAVDTQEPSPSQIVEWSPFGPN